MSSSDMVSVDRNTLERLVALAAAHECVTGGGPMPVMLDGDSEAIAKARAILNPRDVWDRHSFIADDADPQRVVVALDDARDIHDRIMSESLSEGGAPGFQAGDEAVSSSADAPPSLDGAGIVDPICAFDARWGPGALMATQRAFLRSRIDAARQSDTAEIARLWASVREYIGEANDMRAAHDSTRGWGLRCAAESDTLRTRTKADAETIRELEHDSDRMSAELQDAGKRAALLMAQEETILRLNTRLAAAEKRASKVEGVVREHNRLLATGLNFHLCDERSGVTLLFSPPQPLENLEQLPSSAVVDAVREWQEARLLRGGRYYSDSVARFNAAQDALRALDLDAEARKAAEDAEIIKWACLCAKGGRGWFFHREEMEKAYRASRHATKGRGRE